MLTFADKVGGSKKGKKHADVILEWFQKKANLRKFWLPQALYILPR